MTRETRTQLLAGLALAAFLFASGGIAVSLGASAGRHKLGYADRAEDSDPPQVALGIAMGAFRGLFVNVLWIRANALKEAGRYHEAIDLASAITKLQPRFPQVWAFHAWNMAYNISVTTQTPEERWQWVQAGIKLLRDEGIPANDNDMLLHKELGWIYLHKIQGYSDDANQFYKRQVAGEWTTVLGPPPVINTLVLDRRAASETYANWLQPIVDAPDTLAAVIRAEPSVRTLLDRLKAEAGLEPGLEFLRWYETHRALASSAQRDFIRGIMNRRHRAMEQLMGDPSFAAAWAALVPHVRKRVLMDEYGMEPVRMVRYTRKYGPLDWRHPASHGVYWSARGVEQALLRRTQLNERDFDLLNTDRITVQSIQELWRSGEIYFDYLAYATDPFARDTFYFTLPNVQFIPVYGEIAEENAKRSWADNPQLRGSYTPLAAGYENFLQDAIRYLYRRGQKAEASRIKDELGAWTFANINDPERPERFALPIDEFVKTELQDRYITPNVAREEVVGGLLGAFASGLLGGDMRSFNAQIDYARSAHRYFFEQQFRVNSVDPNFARMEQMPRDFNVLAGGVFANFVSILDLDDAQAVYDRAPPNLKLYAYDVLAARFRAMLDADAAQTGQSFDALFPAPEGLDAHRARLEQRRREMAPNVAPK